MFSLHAGGDGDGWRCPRKINRERKKKQTDNSSSMPPGGCRKSTRCDAREYNIYEWKLSTNGGRESTSPSATPPPHLQIGVSARRHDRALGIWHASVRGSLGVHTARPSGLTYVAGG